MGITWGITIEGFLHSLDSLLQTSDNPLEVLPTVSSEVLCWRSGTPLSISILGVTHRHYKALLIFNTFDSKFFLNKVKGGYFNGTFPAASWDLYTFWFDSISSCNMRIKFMRFCFKLVSVYTRKRHYCCVKDV